VHGGEVLEHQLPFSATLSLNFAGTWPGRAILEFAVPATHPAVALAHLGDLTKTVPKNQGQLEVAVAPGQLRVGVARAVFQNKPVYSAVLEPIGGDVAGWFDAAIAKRKAAEQQKPVVKELDGDDDVRRTFNEADANAIIAFRQGQNVTSWPAEGQEIEEGRRTFFARDGKKWVLHSWDTQFGYLFQAYP
jgi:hypothetical protein